MNNLEYVYLHGLASSPQSAKARYLRARFLASDLDLKILDLNLEDFSHLTLTRQLEQTQAECLSSPRPAIVIGSSFGGLTAAFLGEKHVQIQRLVLLAPAFGFLSHWLTKLGEQKVQQWQQTGYLSVYHYGEMRALPLHYQFVVDASKYQEQKLKRPIPTLILHGRKDDVVPIQFSRDYALNRPWVELIELEDDHLLAKVMPEIWQEIQDFCQLDFNNGR